MPLTDPLSFDPNRPDFSPYGLTCVHWRPSPMRRPDHHNEIELNFLESGTVTYLFGGKKVVIDAGRLTAFWAAIPHQIIDFGSVDAYFVATIPLQCFLQWRLPEHFTQALLQGQLLTEPFARGAVTLPAQPTPLHRPATPGGRSLHARQARTAGLSAERGDRSIDSHFLVQWERDLADRTPALEKAVLLEMQARLMRLALRTPPTCKQQPKRERIATITDNGLNKVEQMACFVARRYTERLTVQQIADCVKLHPNYAMNLFQKTFGATLVDYLTQHRVSHAQRLLATSDRTIAEIAFDAGFNSISRFNEAFRRACGCSPREYRQAHAFKSAPPFAKTA